MKAIAMRQKTIAAIFCAAAVFASACAERRPYTKETFVMGTKAWVTIAGMSDREAEKAAIDAFREMYRIESVMSNWRAKSEISRLNTESNGKPFAVSRELYAMIDSSFFYSKATEGAFDVTVRPLVLLWGFEGGTAKLPTDAEIAQKLAFVGHGKVTLDSSRSTITLPRGMQIDLAGIAKGYAVDRSMAVLRSHGVTNALVNLGGNIFALGTSPGEHGWRIGIRDPSGAAETVGSLLLRDAAVATSGQYENFVELGGKHYGHIIDPRTGRPVSRVLSVTVVAPTGLASDALSTGLFVLGPERAGKVIQSLTGVRALYALPGSGAAVYKSVGDFGTTLHLGSTRSLR